ncbi:unnamed protein product [Porites evermanni]|uniref:F5/8 type C domain-containing protein n=1 Tax=Porites evermanni TaxID=104178 RepID=A0ABN8N2L8_9CNID|nr:unnamed protein product [Porites evermanni]
MVARPGPSTPAKSADSTPSTWVASEGFWESPGKTESQTRMPAGRPNLRFKDVCKRDLKAGSIKPCRLGSCRDRGHRRLAVKAGTAASEERREEQWDERRDRRRLRAASIPTEPNMEGLLFQNRTPLILSTRRGIFYGWWRCWRSVTSPNMVFTANSDRYTVVKNVLDKPVITRYLRIHPESWYKHISMRTEFYGCKKGFRPPIIVCASALGMENGKIPDTAIVASSRYNQYWGPERGRLNEKKDGSFNGGWASQYGDAYQFLQIDLGNVTKVTRIATQGRYDAGWWTTTYTLSYSNDGAAFTAYKNGEVFQGNTDYRTAVGHILEPAIIARFIKINVKTYRRHPTLRVELFGCSDGFATPKPPQCMEALGMQSGDIPDSAITASSSANAFSHAPSVGRLHFLSAGSGRYGSWAAGANNAQQWFQVDFGSWTKVTAIRTQGRQDSSQWVKTFSISYSYDSVFHKTVYNEHGSKKIFTANYDRYTVVENMLDKPIVTRYLRIHPESWQSHISMRTEFLGCKKGFQPPKLDCQSALGMKSGQIPNSAITASSSYNQYYGPERARLETVKSGSYFGAWIPKANDQGQWIQVDLGKITKITRIGIQGRQDASRWVKSYSLTYSVEGGPFLPYSGGRVLLGNKDRNTIVGSILNPSIIARYLRIHPREYYIWMSLRFELYGCTSGFPIPKVPPCQVQLGMQNGKLPNSALSASSQWNSYYGPENARLHFHPQSGRNGAWIPKKQDHHEWFQVDFGIETQVTRIETQGRQDASEWVKAYTLRYSLDGSYFKHYQPSGHTKTFVANNDRYTVVGHDLKPPIRTRYLRIIPEQWQSDIALRAEFYGCKANDGGYSEWSSWSQCSATCGGGRYTRSRSCTNPPPSAGGKDCSELGPEKETGECNNQGCPVNGGYSAWGPYRNCSKSCGGGVQTRNRTCTNPPPAYGGSDCSKLGPDISIRECNNQDCPVNGGYSNWNSWSDCSVSCGGGRKARSRSCNNPAPQHGGKDCSSLGPSFQTIACNTMGCPVDGGYSNWNSWSDCSVSCGGGRKARSRSCNNPAPQHGGKDCSSLGPSFQTIACNTMGCPVNGGYSAWGPYRNCSKSCGGGVQTRTRTCTNPPPAYGGNDCSKLGPNISTRECNNHGCPVDGGYSNWNSWSDCSVSCGGGRKARSRRCNNPA